MRPLRPMEMVAGASVLGSVLAVAVPAFVRNLHASRLAEPMDGLKHIGTRATAQAEGKPVAEAYPEPAPLTPGEVPSGQSVEDSPEVWDHPTWVALDFRIEHPHYFSFAFDSKNKEDKSTFTATAHADLDGDGVLSWFQIHGEYLRGESPVLYPIEIQREVE